MDILAKADAIANQLEGVAIILFGIAFLQVCQLTVLILKK